MILPESFSIYACLPLSVLPLSCYPYCVCSQDSILIMHLIIEISDVVSATECVSFIFACGARYNARLAIERTRVRILVATVSKIGNFRSLHDTPVH